MNECSPTLLLIGHGSPDPEGNAALLQFAEALARYLEVPTQPCFLELAEPSIEAGVARCVAAGARNLVALPLFLGSGRHHKRDVPALLAAAQSRFPDLVIRYGTPLGTQLQLVDVLAARAATALAEASATAADPATALLVVGRGSKDPQSNAELPRVARLLSEVHGYPLVEYAFQAVATPNVGQAIIRCIRLGAERIVVLPYLLFTGVVYADLQAQARATQALHPGLEVRYGTPLFPHPGLLAAAALRYEEVLAGTATMNCDLCSYRQRAGAVGTHDHDQDHHDHDHHHDHQPEEETR